MNHRIFLSIMIASAFFLASCSGCGSDDDSDSPGLAIDDDTDDDAGADDTSATDDASDDSFADDDSAVADDAQDDTAAADDTVADDDTALYDYEGWIVGWTDTANGPEALIRHDDHGRWEPEAFPALPGASKLYDVDFVDAQNGWAVGEVQFANATLGLVLHRDASGWRVDGPVTIGCGSFTAVDFLDADHGWIACGSSIYTIGFRYETGTWTPRNLGMIGLFTFYDVAAVGADDAYFAGALNMEGGQGWLIEDFLTDWDYAQRGTINDWFGGVAFGGGEGYASLCQWRGISFPVRMSHFDGSAWSQDPSPPALAGCIERFAFSPGGTWMAVGAGDLGNQSAPAVFEQTPTGWQLMDAPDSSGYPQLHDIGLPADNFGIAAGAETATGGTTAGYALQFDGGSWKGINSLSETDATFHGVSYTASPRRPR